MATATVRDILRIARNEDWPAARLVAVFPTMSTPTATKLLAGSAIITEVRDDGSFTVYVPGQQVG